MSNVIKFCFWCIIIFCFISISNNHRTIYPLNPETHIMIDWGKTLQEQDVIDIIQLTPNLQYLKHNEHQSITQNQLQRIYKYRKQFYRSFKAKSKKNNKGYIYNYIKNDKILVKGVSPFNVYYFKDTCPTYDYIGKNWKKKSVNGTMMKRYIRRTYKLGFGIHVTDCKSESVKHRQILQE